MYLIKLKNSTISVVGNNDLQRKYTVLTELSSVFATGSKR